VRGYLADLRGSRRQRGRQQQYRRGEIKRRNKMLHGNEKEMILSKNFQGREEER
jgi:hypothetical protein